jgi:hypothetical protein
MVDPGTDPPRHGGPADRRTAILLGVLVGALTVAIAAQLVAPSDAGWWVSTGSAVAATVLLAVAWWRERAGLRPLPTRRVAAGIAILVLALSVVGPVRGSRDVWAYATYGSMIVDHGADPYHEVPAAYPDDPYVERMAPRWWHTKAVYGPVFVGMSCAIIAAVGDHPLAVQVAFKALAAVAMGAVVWLLLRERVHPAMVAFLVLHPGVSVWGLGGGHADPLPALAMLGAVLLARRRRPALAGVVVAAGVLVKITGGLVVPPLLAWLWFRPDARGRRDAITLAAVSGGLVAAAYGVMGLDTLQPVKDQSMVTGWATIWRPLSLATSDQIQNAGWTRVSTALILLSVVIVCWNRRHDVDPFLACALVCVAYSTFGAYELVWYLCWLLPIVALRWRSATGAVAAAIGLALVAGLGNEHAMWWMMASCAAASAVLVGREAWQAWRSWREADGPPHPLALDESQPAPVP